MIDVEHDKATADLPLPAREPLPKPPVTGWALVTGACSGIGLAIARELAARGYPLVLVSNQETSLRAAGRSLAREYRVPIREIPMDLAHPQAASVLHEEIRRLGLQVEVLVSNAGILMFGEVAAADPEQANTLLQLHVVTPSLLATHFSRDMRAKRRGYVLFVSSIAANRDFPGIAYYGSSKRYLRSFAAALGEELRPWGVGVTCVLPGAVATDLYGKTSVLVKTALKYRVMATPEQVARVAVRGMFARKRIVVPGMSAKLMNTAMRLTPRPLIRLIQDRSNWLERPLD